MVLVSAALLGLLAIGFSQLIGDASKGQKSVQNAVDFDILKTSINMVLNTKACDGAFRDAAGNIVSLSFPASLVPGTNIISGTSPISVQKIMQGNSTIAELGTSLGGGMTVSKLELRDALYDGDQIMGTPAVTYRAFVASLYVETEKAKGAYGNQKPSKTFSIRLLLKPNVSNTAGTVEKCEASSASGMRTITKSELPTVFAGKWTVGTFGSSQISPSGSYKIDNSMRMLQCTGAGGTGTCSNTGILFINSGTFSLEGAGAFYHLTLTGIQYSRVVQGHVIGITTPQGLSSQFLPWGN